MFTGLSGVPRQRGHSPGPLLVETRVQFARPDLSAEGYTMRLKRWTLCAGLAILILSGCSQSPRVREARSLEKGRKEFQKKNYAVAILHFKTAAQALPRDAEPYYQLGLAY